MIKAVGIVCVLLLMVSLVDIEGIIAAIAASVDRLSLTRAELLRTVEALVNR